MGSPLTKTWLSIGTGQPVLIRRGVVTSSFFAAQFRPQLTLCLWNCNSSTFLSTVRLESEKPRFQPLAVTQIAMADKQEDSGILPAEHWIQAEVCATRSTCGHSTRTPLTTVA